MTKSSIAVIVLNWNDADLLPHSVGSILDQTKSCDIIIVDNASKDNSKNVINSFGNTVTVLWNTENLGFAGGVNTGIRYAIEKGYEYIALLNNDATADKDWVKHLHAAFAEDKFIGATTSAMLHAGDNTYDSTGEFYTLWGLAFPRGRDEPINGQYDSSVETMGVSGGASMFRASMFKDVGLFDEDFFAYYEDVDLGLRAHTRGWRFVFAPKASVLHATGTTSGRVKNFGTYQGLKNQPLLLIKNLPFSLFVKILPRFVVAHSLFTLRALSRKQVSTVLKVWLVLLWLIPKKCIERVAIQRRRVPTATADIKNLLVYDLPHNATALRKFRSIIRKVFPKFV
jgi:hypothetical protein